MTEVTKWNKGKFKRDRYNQLYMDMAERIAKMSYAKRLQVGCVVVFNDNILSYGWNGMPSGWDNTCEHYILGDEEMTTKPEVLHAEANALTKLSRSTSSSLGASIYVTHAPCIECAKLIHQSGITHVYYKSVYRSDDGINFLGKCRIVVQQINDNKGE